MTEKRRQCWGVGQPGGMRPPMVSGRKRLQGSYIEMVQDISHKSSRKALGRGLSALLGAATPQEEEALRLLPLAQVHANPHQPRRFFDDVALGELAHSIKENGVLQPILVREISPQHYEIIAGERRWRGASAAGLHKIPCRIWNVGPQEALEVALLENIQREDLNPLEEAWGYKELLHNFSYTQEDLAHKIGKSRSHIANILRLLQLPPAVQQMVRDGKLSAGHAKVLLAAEDIPSLAQDIVQQGLTVRETEGRVAKKFPKGKSGQKSGAKTNKDASPESAATLPSAFWPVPGEDEDLMAQQLASMTSAAVTMATLADGSLGVSFVFPDVASMERFMEALHKGLEG